MIEDHDVGRVDPPPRLLVKAARSVAAAGALGADARLAADQIPDGGVRQRIEISQRSVARATTPIEDAFEFDGFGRGEEFGAVFQRFAEAARTQVILPTFEQRSIEFHRQ